MIRAYSKLKTSQDIPEEHELLKPTETHVFQYPGSSEIKEVSVEVSLDTQKEPSYGEDVDKTRGEPLETVEDLDYNKDEILVTLKSGEPKYVIDFSEAQRKEIQDFVEIELNKIYFL